MREAKNVATILGTIAVCLVSGLLVADKAAPNVNSSNMVEIDEPASEEMTVAAIQTSVSTTTAIVTTTAATTTIELTTTTAPAETTTTTTTTTAPEIVTEAVQENTPEELPPEPVAEPEAPVEDSAPEEPAEEETETETPTEPETEPETESETEAPADEQETVDDGISLPISDEEYVVLCNVVAHEAGSNWISENEKAKVVEVIMNRVDSSLFPNTITEVLTQPGQFTGSESYAFNGEYISAVTEAVHNAVRLYFHERSSFSEGYLYFWGDGRQNHFR